jgi:MFS family permease
VHCLGDKYSLIIGSLTYAIYTASQVLPVLRSEHPDNKTLHDLYGFMYGLILFTAALNGWGASILWVAQGKYMSECCSDQNEGLFYSIFWIFNMVSLIVGNLMAAFVVQKIDLSMFYYIMTFINFLCVFWFFILPKPKQIQD